MLQEQIDRINFLAKKKKEEGLTKEELKEQKELRDEYIKQFRQGMKNTLNNVYIVEKDGSKTKLTKK